MIVRHHLRSCCLAGLLLAAPAAACAQGGHGGGRGPGPGMGSGGMGPGNMGGGMGMPHSGIGLPPLGGAGGNVPRGGSPPNGSGASGSMRGGLQLAPRGRWWDDKKFARSLGLNADQQKRMDAVFGQNRDALLARYETLQHAESRLDALTHNGKPSETALSTEIDHVAQARAELEKAYTHMLLQLRDEMTPDQLGKLDDHR